MLQYYGIYTNGEIMGQFKIYYQLIKDIINGDEYISDKDKFTLLLHLCALVHLIDSFYFWGFSNILLLLYNLGSVLLYESLVPFAKNKQFKFITAVCSIEVLIFVFFNSLEYGTMLNFNLYCFIMVPAAFYITSMAKDIKHPFILSLIISILATVDYAFSIVVTPNNIKSLTEHQALASVVNVSNVIFTIIIIGAVCFFFTMEMRNSTAELTSRNEMLKKLSSSDPLTKLPNRRSMMEQLNIAMHQLKKDKKPFSLVLGDIDDFKKVNDTYGHDGGDKVLLMVSETLMNTIRKEDFVCRWGGEEILILVKGDLAEAGQLAQRILNNITAETVIHEGYEIHVTMTFGVAEAKDNLRYEDFLQQADNRLYYGKGHGKNQVVTEIPANY